MKRRCDVCGIEADDYWMVPYNIGTKTKWLCWKCSQTADREASQSDLIRGYRLHKICESKRVKK